MPPRGDDPTRSTEFAECELRRPRILSQVPSRLVQCGHVTLAVVEAGTVVPHRRNPPSRTGASNRLTGCGRLVTATLAQLLKFSGEYPVHAEIVAEVFCDVTVSAAFAVAVDLLE